ncbi:hypothetical protein HDU98_005969 [Podochytrium sp. JEL0797]|nr:hypothetical protein HDU98_005969 [Podochytrium sp. JEL0797]
MFRIHPFRATAIGLRLASSVAKPPTDTSLTGKITEFVAASKAMASLYYNGTKQLYRNSKEASALIVARRGSEAKGLTPASWTRDQFLMVQQTSLDMKKLPPFLILVLILPESIPFILTFSPSMIPSTCVSPAQKQTMWTKLKEKRITVAEGWVREFESHKGAALGEWVTKEVGLERVLDQPQGVVHLAKHAPQYFEVENMSREMVKGVNMALGLTHRAVRVSALKGALLKRWETVAGDDAYLAGRMEGGVGISSLTEEAIWAAAEMRGISTVGKTRVEIERELKLWLETTMNEENVRVPAGLMFLSTLIRQQQNK